MARQKKAKSLSDIDRQYNRIMYGSIYVPPGGTQRVQDTAVKYRRNIMNYLGIHTNEEYNNAKNIKVPRRVYMGLSNG